MWPILYSFLRSNARYVVLPVAVVIGAVGYTIENMVSSKYTPYQPSIEQQRINRLTSEEELNHPTNVRKQSYENVLDKNLSKGLIKT